MPCAIDPARMLAIREKAIRLNSWLMAVEEGMTVVDIGANRGAFTEPLIRRVGQTGRVYAIEPQPALAAGLRQHGATVLTFALGDEDGIGLLYEGADSQHASLYQANVLAPTGASLTVPIARLDSLQAVGAIASPVHVLKIDAQGAEQKILAGAARLLETQRPLVYIEVWADGLRAAGGSVEGVCNRLAHYGYRPARNTWAREIAAANRCQLQASTDIFCVPD